MLCLPEDIAIKNLQAIISHLKNDCLLVDTLSVKKLYLDLLATLPNYADKVKILSINLLFKPSLGFEKNKIAIIEGDFGIIGETFIQCLEKNAAETVYCTVNEHDELMSIIQTLPHTLLLIFGLVLTETNYNYKKTEGFMTPPFKTILALLARIINGNPHVYFDIQVNNPFAKQVKENLIDKLEYFNELTALP